MDVRTTWLFGTSGLSLIAVGILVRGLFLAAPCKTSIGLVQGFEDFCVQELQQHPTLPKDIEKLELFLNGLGSAETISLHFLEAQGILRTSAMGVVLSREFLSHPGFIEKSLIKSWLLQRANAGVLNDPLSLEVVSDVLYAAVIGQARTVSAVSQQALLLGGPNGLSSWGEYCSSPWRRAENRDYCEGILSPPNAVKRTEMKMFSEFSMRPVLSAALWTQLTSIDILGRIESLKVWVEKLSHTSAVTPAPFVSLGDVAKMGSNYLTALELQPESSKEILPKNLVISANPEARGDAISTDQESVWFPGSTAPVILTLKGARFERAVIEICTAKLPRDSWLRFARKTLVVRHCNDSRTSFESFFRGDVSSFALQNPSAYFAVIHREGLEVLESWGLKRQSQFQLKAPFFSSTRVQKLAGLSVSPWARGRMHELRAPVPLVSAFQIP